MFNKLTIACLLVSSTSAAAAQESAETTAVVDAQTAPADEWHLAISPYVWLTSFSGDVTVRDIQFDATKSFVEILEDSDRVFGLMGAIDLEYHGFVFQLNGAVTTADVSQSRGILQNTTVNANIDLTSTWIEFFGGYRFVDIPLGSEPGSSRRLTLDAFAGGRVTNMDVDTRISAAATVTLPEGDILSFGQTRDRDDSETWFEPFVGARLTVDLTESWVFNVRGDIGGFGVGGADFAWQAAAQIGYRWHLDGWDIGVFGGYRAIGQDYADGEFGWDMITHGPVLGAQFSFAF